MQNIFLLLIFWHHSNTTSGCACSKWTWRTQSRTANRDQENFLTVADKQRAVQWATSVSYLLIGIDQSLNRVEPLAQVIEGGGGGATVITLRWLIVIDFDWY